MRNELLVCHCWLVQQWAVGTRFALLVKPAVAPVQLHLCTSVNSSFEGYAFIFAGRPPRATSKQHPLAASPSTSVPGSGTVAVA